MENNLILKIKEFYGEKDVREVRMSCAYIVASGDETYSCNKYLSDGTCMQFRINVSKNSKFMLLCVTYNEFGEELDEIEKTDYFEKI